MPSQPACGHSAAEHDDYSEAYRDIEHTARAWVSPSADPSRSEEMPEAGAPSAVKATVFAASVVQS